MMVHLFDGVVYDILGFYTNIYTGSNGCDSTVNLDLTIFYTSSQYLNITACGYYLGIV